MTLNHIELFAGCGGLSLGLESEGYNLVFANELSPMAGETFAFNLLGDQGENLKALGEQGKKAERTFWLNSQFSRNELLQRLRENPREAPALGQGFNDLDDDDANLKGGLVIADIISLNKYLNQNTELLNKIKSGFGSVNQGVDLVSGGPPCQSFSMAGLRQHDNERNQLPMAFANFVGLVKPRAVVLENVTGILRAFDVKGKKYYAWFEVAKAFVEKGYVPICLHVNAKYVGAAQNRPRFIMLAFRKDVFSIYKAIVEKEQNLKSFEILKLSENFYRSAKGNEHLVLEDSGYYYHDVEKHPESFKRTFLSSFLTRDKSNFHTVSDAIDDLRLNNPSKPSTYVEEINNLLDKDLPESALNHEMRSNSFHVRKRFSLYQALSEVSPQTRKKVSAFLRLDDESVLDENVVEELSKHRYLISEDNEKKQYLSKGRDSIVAFLRSLRTKKQTQRALISTDPAPAALSIPDDACHYDKEELRTLSVREMARIQSFPDWFELRSKVTTGGKMRRFEVPQYTQVGNAVPPLLGAAIGKVVKTILSTVDSSSLRYKRRETITSTQAEVVESL